MKMIPILFLLIVSALSLHAEQPKTVNKKDIAITAAKITGYALGCAISIQWLAHAYNDYDDTQTFMYEFLLKPLQDAKSNPETRGADISIACGHGAILSCLGYSTYGLYTELNPHIKTLACWAQQKINALRKK